nr:MAG TPA: hypothetical protein [Caudoviricetes sp.]
MSVYVNYLVILNFAQDFFSSLLAQFLIIISYNS